MSARRRRKSNPAVPKYVMVHHWMLNSAAYRALRPYARLLIFQLAMRFDGSNNGEISMSVREAADELDCSKNHAASLFEELQQKGFAFPVVKGAFTIKDRHATTWRLTWLITKSSTALTGFEEPTKEFMRWRPHEKSEPENLETGTAARYRQYNGVTHTRSPGGTVDA